MKIMLFFMTLLLCGCAGSVFHGMEPERKLSFRGIIVENPEKHEIFYMRPLFEKGTGEALPVTGYREYADATPCAMKGVLRKDLQHELVVLGLMDTIISGNGMIGEMKETVIRFPLIGMKEPVLANLAGGELSLLGLPYGLDGQYDLSPGESVVFGWFDRNRQLTLLVFTS